MELTAEGYQVLGAKTAVRAEERLAAIESVLPTAAPGLTADEVVGLLPGAMKPGKRTVALDLNSDAGLARWDRAGTGHKGDPYRYRRRATFDSRSTHSLGARNESDGPGRAAGAGEGVSL